MALVSVNQFFQNHPDIPDEKRNSIYLSYRNAVKKGKINPSQKIDGISYAEEADLLVFCEPYKTIANGLVQLSVFRKQHNHLSEQMFWEYAKKGKLKTAQKINGRWYIDKEEAEEFALWLEQRGEQKTREAVCTQQGYITAREYAAAHGIDYQQFLRQVKEGLFPCEQTAGVYLIAKDTPFVRYISPNKYAKENDLPFLKVKKAIDNGRFQSAVKCSNGRWYVNADEKPAFK